MMHVAKRLDVTHAKPMSDAIMVPELYLSLLLSEDVTAPWGNAVEY